MTESIIAVLDITSLLLFGIIIGNSFNKSLEPRFNRFVNIGVLTVVTTGVNYFMAYSSLGASLIPDYGNRMSIKAISLMVFWCVFAVVFYKDRFIDKVKAYIFMQIFIAVSEIFLGAVLSGILGKSAVELQYGGITERASMFFMSVTEYLIAGIGVYVVCRRKNLKIPDSAFATFGGIVFVACVMIGFVANSNSTNKDTPTMILLMVSPLLLVVLCFLLYRIMRKLSEREQLEQRLAMMDNIKSIELSYQTQLSDKAELLRRFRHDYKGNVETLKGLISSGESEGAEKALELLDSMSQKLESTSVKKFSDNMVVNTVLSSMSESALKNGVVLNSVVDVPRDLAGIEIIDLNCLFVNMLNNAIEASVKLPEEQNRVVTIRAGVKAGFLVVKTTNAYTEMVSDKNGIVQTTKDDKTNHGIGLALIKEVCGKYEGEFSFETDDDLCTVTAGIKLN